MTLPYSFEAISMVMGFKTPMTLPYSFEAM